MIYCDLDYRIVHILGLLKINNSFIKGFIIHVLYIIYKVESTYPIV